MVKRKNHKITRFRIVRIVRSIFLVLFVVSLFSLIWGWISRNAMWVVIITGIVLLIFVVLGILTPNSIKKKLRQNSKI